MNLLSSMNRALPVAALLSLGACIQGDCVTVPCAQPLALSIRVSSTANGGPVPNAVAQVTGPVTATVPCAGDPSTCLIAGNSGTYTVIISAPGFQSVTRTVTVRGTAAQRCGCETVEAGHLDVGLTAAS